MTGSPDPSLCGASCGDVLEHKSPYHDELDGREKRHIEMHHNAVHGYEVKEAAQDVVAGVCNILKDTTLRQGCVIFTASFMCTNMLNFVYMKMNSEAKKLFSTTKFGYTNDGVGYARIDFREDSRGTIRPVYIPKLISQFIDLGIPHVYMPMMMRNMPPLRVFQTDVLTEESKELVAFLARIRLVLARRRTRITVDSARQIASEWCNTKRILHRQMKDTVEVVVRLFCDETTVASMKHSATKLFKEITEMPPTIAQLLEKDEVDTDTAEHDHFDADGKHASVAERGKRKGSSKGIYNVVTSHTS